MTAAITDDGPCPVCAAPCRPLGAVDFNKNCEESRGLRLPTSGRLVRYVICERCDFCFAPEFAAWSAADFSREIYNADYVDVDPDAADARPRATAAALITTFGTRGPPGRHLDYGGGAGLLSTLLGAAGWRSTSYDPFFQNGVDPTGVDTFNLITCFEVFEHVADVNRLARDLGALLADGGLILFSTQVSDGELRRGQPIDWWYASPRNGHISLHSSKSLGLLAGKHDFGIVHFPGGMHAYWRKQFPHWARHLLANS